MATSVTSSPQMLLLSASLLAIGLVSNRGDAEILRVNNPNIVGDGSLAQDGYNLTRDTETRLEWLDLTLSLGRSFNDVSSQFDPGEDYEGFQYATGSEISMFWTNAGVQFVSENDPAIDLLVIYVGRESSGAIGNVESRGLYDDIESSQVESKAGSAYLISRIDPLIQDFAFILTDQYEKLSANPGVASWLVRSFTPIPEPQSFCLGVFGVTLLGFLQIKRQ